MQQVCRWSRDQNGSRAVQNVFEMDNNRRSNSFLLTFLNNINSWWRIDSAIMFSSEFLKKDFISIKKTNISHQIKHVRLIRTLLWMQSSSKGNIICKIKSRNSTITDPAHLTYCVKTNLKSKWKSCFAKMLLNFKSKIDWKYSRSTYS